VSDPLRAEGSDVILAVDLGGSRFDAGLVTMRGELLDRARIRVDHDLGAEKLWGQLAELLTGQKDRARQHRARITAVGVASSGTIGRNLSTVSPINIPAWYNFELGRRLSEHLGLPIFGDLDAKALALSEGWLGAAKGHANFCAISVGDGVGGGIVIDGHMLEGTTGNAGHVGHVIVVPGGRRCACGAQGCLEAEASGLAIESITGRPTTEPTYEIMQRTGQLVGRASAAVCLSMDLDLVVVGGSVAFAFAATLFASAQEELDMLSAAWPFSPRIVSARLGDKGPLVGAAALAIRGLNQSKRSSSIHSSSIHNSSIHNSSLHTGSTNVT
jgi:glucokinase